MPSEQTSVPEVAARPDTPPETAGRLGHAVSWDPPYGSSVERWTCSTCGRAVLRHHGNVYGTAIEVPCETSRAGVDRD